MTALSEDEFIGGAVRVLQPVKGYRAGIDAVLLAATVAAKAGDEILDLGCGVGTAGLCLMGRLPDVRVTGLELQSVLYDIALKNRELNQFEDRWSLVQGDLLQLPADLPLGSFDQVICNPPFMPKGRSNASPDPIKLLANHEGEALLRDWILAALKLVKHKGAVTIVHRADRLDEILSVFREKKAGAVQVFPLWPYAGQAAKRVVVRARRSVSGPLSICAGQVLHKDDGSYSDVIDGALRKGLALPF
ncbi:methyltransferase [Kiloniella laminariae]|uniref:Methyltransferase n=1 Tax=Kiloniella laminariae TaxID=454162 RepID=A0ABT4LF25_9PROT|nr:methyltransferase [Kiloniella laminariae]MCZ4279525.1 methyltransferase [Kiloniella laminariae]